MSRSYEVVPASSVTAKKRKSPMHVILEKVEGDWWSMQRVADHIGVHIETIRRVTKKEKVDGTPLVNAPSSAVRAGDAVIYLFSKDDVIEMENHFEARGYVLQKRIDPDKLLSEQDAEPEVATA